MRLHLVVQDELDQPVASVIRMTPLDGPNVRPCITDIGHSYNVH